MNNSSESSFKEESNLISYPESSPTEEFLSSSPSSINQDTLILTPDSKRVVSQPSTILSNTDLQSAPPTTLIKHLETLADVPNEAPAFREALKRIFTQQTSPAREASIIQAGIASGNDRVRDIARSIGFISQVAQSGFPNALETAEEQLFPNSQGSLQDEEFLDFIAEEIAPQDQPATLEWLHQQGPDLWEDALPLVLGDWAANSPGEVGAWIQGLEAGNFRDRAVAEYVPVLARNGEGFSNELVGTIQDEDIRQEARIRTGELNFSVLSQR